MFLLRLLRRIWIWTTLIYPPHHSVWVFSATDDARAEDLFSWAAVEFSPLIQVDSPVFVSAMTRHLQVVILL